MLKLTTTRLLLAGAMALLAHTTLFAQGALAAGDPASGEKVFKKCAVCHSLEEGTNKVGPSLHGIFGRTAGHVDGFKYSKVMAESGIVWDESTIDAYLADPKGYLPKNRMAFAGLKKETDRADLIAYLKANTQ